MSSSLLLQKTHLKNVRYVPTERVKTTYTTYTPSGRQEKVIYNYAAGRPTNSDHGSFSPTGSSTIINTTRVTPRYTETIRLNPPEPKEHTIYTTTDDNKWTSFDTIVERSQKEIEDLMKYHKIKDDSPVSFTTNSVVRAPANALSTRNITRLGNSVTEREEKKWDDFPSPGLNRNNKTVVENTEIKDWKGNVVGHKKIEEHQSNASGEKEQILPDGTKRKIFTKSYETRSSYKTTTDPKAL